MITTLLLSKLNTGLQRAGILKVLCLLLLNLALAFTVQGQTVVEVPSGNPTNSNPDAFIQRFPLSNFNPYEASASLYLGSDINTSGTISTVGFYLEATNGTVPTL